MIRIIDSFLGNDINDYIQWCLPKLNYELHSSIEGSNKHNFFKSVGEVPDNLIFEYIAEKISDINFINLKKFERAYVNLNPAGQQSAGDYHIDDGDITALYYPQQWNSSDGGTLFSNGEYVEYINDRLLIFDAKLPHRATAHNNIFRYTIAYKMKATWNT